ncbi:MAG: hypothetical protein ACP5I1_11545 [Candidatus Hinthialibacter sp.]
MADQISTAGQYIPLSRNDSPSNSLSSYTNSSVGSGKQYQGQSFYDILNRNQLTSAQLKSMQAPETKIIAKIPVNQSSANQTAASPAFVPSPESAYNHQLIEETNQHLQNIPPETPQLENLDNVILKNMQEYFHQKAAQEHAADAPAPSAPLSPKPSPESGAPEANADDVALHNILAQNAVNAAVLDAPAVSHTPEISTPQAPPLEHAPIGEPLITPTPSLPEMPPESTPVSGFPAYIPAAQFNQTAKSSANINNPATTLEQEKLAPQPQAALETSPPQPIDETSPNENQQTDGFFHAFGALFGNIASAATLGFYRPSSEQEPTGFARVIDPVKKVVWDAPQNILIDMPTGVYHDLTRKNAASSSPNAPDRPNDRGVKAFGHFRTSIRRNFYT